MTPSNPPRSAVRRALRPDLWAGAGVMLIAALVYARYLGGPLPIGVDHTLFHAPVFSLPWDGGPPFWNPYTLAGVPNWNNLQAALLYPLRWPFFFIDDWRQYYGFYQFVHYPILMTGMLVLARAMRISTFGAFGAAVALGLGGHMAGRPLNPSIFYACAWLPWLWAGAVGERGFHRWATALGWAMVLVVGSPHGVVYGALGYAMLTFGYGLRRPGGGPVVAGLLRRAGGVALGTLLAAPTFLPALVRVGATVRARGGDAAANLADSLGWRQVIPTLLGGGGDALYPENIDKCAYAGIVALGLVALLLTQRRSWSDRRVQAALALTLAGLALALGSNVGLQHVMPWLPGLKWLIGPARALILTAAGLALLTGLALERPVCWPKRFGVLCLLLAAGAGAMAWHRIGLDNARYKPPLVPVEWLAAWWAHPQSLGVSIFPWLEAAAGLAALGLVILVWPRRRGRRWALLGLIALQSGHFAPRVEPPMRERAFYDPAPSARFVQAQAGRQTEPFRVAGYDALRLHDMEVNHAMLGDYLVPQLSTLHRLQDLQGFDPLIPEQYAELIEQTAGRARYNDPLRNLDLARPDVGLFRLLGLRYLIGHPYDRRVTNLPLELTPAAPIAPVPAWTDPPANAPLTHWLFISILSGGTGLPPGEPVATLVIEAEEGTFRYPVRNAIETAAGGAGNYVDLNQWPVQRNTTWTMPAPLVEWDFAIRQANYRAMIAFGRPLHVRAARWELNRADVALGILGQACRLARPAPDADPWRLAWGDEDRFAPVFELRAATPRAFLAEGLPQPGATHVELPPAELASRAGAAQIRWLDWRSQGMTLRVQPGRPALLVLREMADPGWQAAVNGRPVTPVVVNGLLLGVPLPAGESQVTLHYAPRAFWMLLGVCWPLVALAGVLEGFAARRRRQRYEPR